MIPKSVTHDDLMKALEPLCELLGTTLQHIYATPPLTIGGPESHLNGRDILGHITFCHVPSDPAVCAEGFPGGTLALAHPQGDDASGELLTIVTVEVV